MFVHVGVAASIAVVAACSDDADRVGSDCRLVDAGDRVVLRSPSQVDLGEVDAVPDAMHPPTVAQFQFDNPNSIPIQVNRVVRSCACLELDPLLELASGATVVSVGIRPQSGRALHQSLWIMLANGQEFQLQIRCVGKQDTQLEAGGASWDMDRPTIGIELTCWAGRRLTT